MTIYLLVFSGKYDEDGWRVGDRIWTDIDLLRADLTARGYVLKHVYEGSSETWVNASYVEVPGTTSLHVDIHKRKVDL